MSDPERDKSIQRLVDIERRCDIISGEIPSDETARIANVLLLRRFVAGCASREETPISLLVELTRVVVAHRRRELANGQ